MTYYIGDTVIFANFRQF